MVSWRKFPKSRQHLNKLKKVKNLWKKLKTYLKYLKLPKRI